MAFKLVAIWTFFFLTGPASSHALANAAHVAGIKPLTGKSLKHETQDDLS
ncbi:MAG: monovalent cation/H(+) antiporter subunit G [Henriciella sp.]